MDVAAVAAAHQRQQRALAARVAREVADLWAGMDPADLDRAWAAAGPRILALVASGQTLAAAVADPYVDDALAAQGVTAPSAGEVNPGALAGVASDGRDLSSLLYEPVITTKAAIGAGADPASALVGGLMQLDMITRTQVADAGRVATGVAMAARPAVGGYIRVLSPPSCSRCAILAGKRYRWNAGFDRHPRCDCTAVPAAGPAADELITNPKAYFHSLSRADQDRLFTKAGAEAIRSGADIGQVVNARSGMYTASGRRFTTSSTSRRGVTRGRVRLMPEQIYAEAGDNREEAIRLLRHHGYLRGEPTASVSAPARRPSLADHVASGEASTRRLGGGISAETELVTFNDGTQAVRKRVTNQWIRDPVESADAEELASILLRRAGVIAPEVYRAGADTIYMELMPGEVADEHWPLGTQGSARVDDEINAFVSTLAGRRLGLLDQVILNTDRNSGNWTVEGAFPGAIDHGGAFAEPISGYTEADILRTVRGPNNRFAYRLYYRYTPADVEVIRGFMNDVRSDFERVGRRAWWDAAMRRLDVLASQARGTEPLWP